MNGISRESLISFGGAVGALGLAAVLARVACPARCPTCTACASTVLPATGTALAVGAALGGSYLARRCRDEADQPPCGSSRD